jgi:hypothetical protein
MRKLIFILSIGVQANVMAQQAYPVGDTAALQAGGLTYGYHIVSEKEKEVGNKGDFSRFSLQFFVTNSSYDAKMLVRRQGSGLLVSNTSYNLVRFQCTNATGARLTSKEVTLQAKPCIIEAIVDDKECGSDKVVQHERPVNIGYWIRPGETITANIIVIVPLNEKPAVMATVFPVNNNTVVGTADFFPENSGVTDAAGGVLPDNHAGYEASLNGILHVRSKATGNFLNGQNNRVICNSIRPDWESAQWELLPVNGRRYYLIRNKLSGRFISADNSSMLSDDNHSMRSLWVLEPTGDRHCFFIRNAGNSSKLSLQNDVLTTSNGAGDQWVMEP